MKNQNLPWRTVALASFVYSLCASAALADTGFAATVIDYHPGRGASLDNPYAAVGKPGNIVGLGSGFDGVFSPFNSHYEASQLTQIGEGGDLTLRLGCSADISAGRADLGIFTNAFQIYGQDPDNPDGPGISTGNFGAASVEIDVSADGVAWTTLGGVTCAFPATAFSDSPTPFQANTDGLTPADFGKPHSLQLSDLHGKTHQEILAVLVGSAGGTWVDLAPTGLDSAAYLRFRVPDDGNPTTANTFELAAVSINSAAAGNAPTALSFVEDFATDPLGTRAIGDTGHATYSAGQLAVAFDPAAGATKRTSWPLGQSLTDQDSFSFSVDFTIGAINFTENNFGQLTFGLINSSTTGNNRTSSPSDAWDLLTIDYFPNEQFATFTPTVIGSQRAGQTDAFNNLRFPSGSASLINDFDEIGQLPTGTALSASLDYDSATRILTLRLNGQAINADFTNTDDDVSTIQYTIPSDIEFNVDSFAILCWQEASGGTADLTFTNLQVSTPTPPANYYSWADTNIATVLDRATGADADGDGLTNLLSYALGGVAPTSAMLANRIDLRWQQLPARSDVIVRAETGTDLKHWSAHSDSILSAAPGIEVHQSTLNLSEGGAFLRLNASRP